MWYAKETSAGQGVIADDETGRSVAVAYDVKDTALLAAAPELLAALQGLASTARTFRNVPKAKQEWTGLDDDALAAAFAAIAKARGHD